MRDSEKLIHIVYGMDNARTVSESDCLVLFNTPFIYGVYNDSMTAFSDLVELEDSESYGHLTWYCETQKIRTESQGKVI